MSHFLGRRLVYGDTYHLRFRLMRWYLRRRGWMLDEQQVTWVACWGGCTERIRTAWPHRHELA